MTYREISELLKKQDVYLEFLDSSAIGPEDDKPNAGMVGRLCSIHPFTETEPGYPEELVLECDFNGFETRNRPFATRDFFDFSIPDSAEPSLTWFDTPEYKRKKGRFDIYITGSLDSTATLVRVVAIGCSCCHGDAAILNENGVKIFVDSMGKLDVFIGDALEPQASTHIKRCPMCGFEFKKEILI